MKYSLTVKPFLHFPQQMLVDEGQAGAALLRSDEGDAYLGNTGPAIPMGNILLDNR